jgi:DNA invertase Pin-like site-specific DNA recombinase
MKTPGKKTRANTRANTREKDQGKHQGKRPGQTPGKKTRANTREKDQDIKQITEFITSLTPEEKLQLINSLLASGFRWLNELVTEEKTKNKK